MMRAADPAAADAPILRPIVAANKLTKLGDYRQARELLEAVDLHADETAAMLYVMVLDKMHDQAGKQDVLEQHIGALAAEPDCSNTYITFLLRQAQRACLAAGPIEKLLAAAAARDREHGELEMVYRAVKRRHAFKQEKAAQAAHLRFISLGTTCLPWTLLNRWGLRDRTKFIDDFNPFCLATHKIAGMMTALESDFEGYTALDQITIEQAPHRQPYALRHDGLVEWNHNQGFYWTQNDFAALRADLQTKINNFRRSCRAQTPVFMITGPIAALDQPEYLPRLRLALSRFTGREDNFIVLTSQSVKSPTKRVARVDDRTFAVYCPMPSREYTWFDLNVADSPEGLKFERGYVRLLMKCLRQWELIDQSDE